MNDQETQELLAESEWLARVAYRLVRDEDEAKDLAQETYLAALHAAPPEGRPLRGWLGRVASNAARMKYRGSTRRAAREQAVGYIDDSPQKLSSRLLHEKQAASILNQTVQRLEEPLRSAVLLRYVDDMTIAQVAAEQGVPVGTADSRIREGLKRLRRDLDTQTDGDARPWLMALCPAVGISETQAASAAATGKTNIMKPIFLSATLLTTLVGGYALLSHGESNAGSTSRERARSQEENAADDPSRAKPLLPALNLDIASSPNSNNQSDGGKEAAVQAGAPGRDTAPILSDWYWELYGEEGNHDAVIARLQDLKTLVSECYSQLAERKLEYRKGGLVRLDIHLIDDADLGALVVRSEYHQEFSTIDDLEFKTCMSASGFAMDAQAPAPEDESIDLVRIFAKFDSREQVTAEDPALRAATLACFDMDAAEFASRFGAAGEVRDEGMSPEQRECLLRLRGVDLATPPSWTLGSEDGAAAAEGAN